MAEPSRDLFVSRLGMLAATLGSSVGLGNIWKFPALTGEHGGASFLLVYVLSTLVVGLPLMIAELLIGRSTRANAYKAAEWVSFDNKYMRSDIGKAIDEMPVRE